MWHIRGTSPTRNEAPRELSRGALTWGGAVERDWPLPCRGGSGPAPTVATAAFLADRERVLGARPLRHLASRGILAIAYRAAGRTAQQ